MRTKEQNGKVLVKEEEFEFEVMLMKIIDKMLRNKLPSCYNSTQAKGSFINIIIVPSNVKAIFKVS